jgi:hypothetical protein
MMISSSSIASFEQQEWFLGVFELLDGVRNSTQNTDQTKHQTKIKEFTN